MRSPEKGGRVNDRVKEIKDYIQIQSNHVHVQSIVSGTCLEHLRWCLSEIERLEAELEEK